MTEGIGFPIKAVIRRTGLSPHVVRIWERRYGAVSPGRTGTNRRRYSEEDIRRLVLLKKAVDAGHGIGDVARLSDDKLAALVDSGAIPGSYRPSRRLGRAVEGVAAELLDQSLAAVRSLDTQELESVLNHALVSLSRPVLLDQLVLPLMRQVGDLWERGELRVAHEHLTTSAVRSFLGGLLQSSRKSSSRSSIVFATPAGQVHELGLLAAAVAAASDGWRVIYLGPNLPAEEIAAAAAESDARAVCLSLVYPPDDPGIVGELSRLREFLPSAVRIVAGGRAVGDYESVLQSVGAVCLPHIAGIRRALADEAAPA